MVLDGGREVHYGHVAAEDFTDTLSRLHDTEYRCGSATCVCV